jgi:N-acylneuraminate cytidylyltransferase
MSPNFKNIKLLAMDVDGVLTDGSMYYSENGDELKKFNTRDGMGIKLLKENGIKIAIITKENTKLVERRAKKLHVDDLFQGVENKFLALEELKKKYELNNSEIAYVGDDVNDIPVLNKVGLSICPNDAINDVKKICDYITETNGGYGVVREIYEQWDFLEKK